MTTTTSLFIPSVFSSADEIAAVFSEYGVVKRVDRVKQTAHVHFVEWHDTYDATDMQRRIQLGGCVKVFYDGSRFWRVFAGKSKPIKQIVLEEMPPWEDPTPDAPIPRFDRPWRQRQKERDILTVPRLERQDSKPIWSVYSSDSLDDDIDALLLAPLPSLAKRSPPPQIESFDFDALVSDPNYGIEANTPKTELRALQSL